MTGLWLLIGIAAAADSDGDGWEDDVVHPSAQVPLSVSIGAGSYIDANAVVGEHVSIGAGCTISVRARVGTGTTLGDRVIVSRSALIGAHATVGSDVFFGRSSVLGDFSLIGSDIAVGFGTTVQPGAIIDDEALLGSTVQIGAGTHLFPQTIVSRGVRVGQHVTVGTSTAQAIIGPDVLIAQDVVVAGGTRIRKDVEIDVGAVIETGTRIGRSVRIGQGATVGEEAILSTAVQVEDCASVVGGTRIPREDVVFGSCGPVVLIDIGGGRHGWSDGHLPRSCAEYRTPADANVRSYVGYLGSGVYRLRTPSGVTDAYCDMLTDGGGWTLLAKFAQPSGGMGGLPQSTYDSLVADAGWIQGDAPVPTVPTSTYLGFDIESHAWADLMGPPGSQRTLRQRFFRNAGSSPSDLIVDYKWNLVYNGHVTQDSVPQPLIAELGVWPLTGRVALQDTSTITWDVPSPTESAFWLPFTSAMADTDVRYAACNGVTLDTEACGAYTNPDLRRFGSAGIAGTQPDNNDPAGAWAPFFDAESASGSANVVYVHQAQVIHGTSGQPTTLQYWVR